MRLAASLTGFLFCGFILSGSCCIILAQENNGPNSAQPLPLSVAHTLDSLQKVDNLEEWLFTIGSYVEEDAVNRIPLLRNMLDLTWRPCRTDAERLAWFNQLTILGYYQLYRGDILGSINTYEKAYQFYFEKPIPHADVVEYVMKPLGNNYTRLGDYDQAIFIQEKSLSLAVKPENAKQLASIYSNLATSARWKGKLMQAQEYAEKGLKAVEKNSPPHGLLLSTLADILFESKQFNAAETRVNEAIRILENRLHKRETNIAYWLISAYQTRGNLLKEKNNPQAAIQFYQKAWIISDEYFKGERKRERAKLAVLLGNALFQLQRPAEAMEKFNLSLSILMPAFQPRNMDTLPNAGQIYGENTILDALEGKAKCLLAMNKKIEALQCFHLMFITERKLRHEFFSFNAKQLHQHQNRKWVELGIRTAYELWESTNDMKYADKVLLMAELSKAQLLLDELVTNLHYNRLKTKDTLLQNYSQTVQAIAYYERESAGATVHDKRSSNIKKELQYNLSLIQKKMNERFVLPAAEMKMGEMESAEDLLSQVPAETTVLEFFAGEESIYVVEATSNGVKQIRRLENAPQISRDINEFVMNYFQAGPEKMINFPQSYYKDAYGLYHILWNNSKSKNAARYLIVPDGIIGYLPFDALLTDSIFRPGIDHWPFLIRKTEVSLLYSLQTFQQQRKFEEKSRQASADKQFAGFFISFDSSKNESLPAVKKERAKLEGVIKGNYYSEQKASLDKFKACLVNSNILHISTHSHLLGEENLPVLELADDKFFLFELYRQTFEPQLVVLSACRTGHGMLAKGEGIISLARGFTAAGASGIVAGLWNIHDESTAELMSSFYKQLMKEKYPAKSLHAAKLEWLKNKHISSSEKLPYFWAGLVYAGNNRPIMVSPDARISSWLWVLAAIPIVVLVLWYFFIRKATAGKLGQ
jgi:tetratricopeptide (TPR) repeat protein